MRLPLLIGVLLIAISILIDIYIYFSIPRKKLLTRMPSRLLYGISSVISISLIITVVLWPKRDLESSLLPIMWLLYAWISIYISKLVACTFSWIGLIPSIFHRKKWPLGKYAGLPIGFLIFLAMWYGALWERHNIDVQEITIESARIPKAFDGYRIVQFSDAHVGTWGNDTAFISSLVNKINSLDPDIVVFTGDIVNRKTDEIIPFISTLGRLRGRHGVYSIMGNHDYGLYVDWPSEEARTKDTQWLRNIQRDMGWQLLDNQHISLKEGNDSIILAGVENWGEPPFPSFGKLDEAIAGVSPDDFTVLLSHNPMHWHNIVRECSNVDLTLAGHTHAMQMRIITPWRNYSLSGLKYPEWEGLTSYKRNDGFLSRVYVNIGCGEVGFPARIGAMPEITVITLKSSR